MCLAIPARIVEIGEDGCAIADMMGARREISIDLAPQAQVGDHVLVHAGFAIEVVDEAAANETLELLRLIPELASEGER